MKEKLLVRTKMAYGVGDLGLTLTGGMLGVLYMKYLTDFEGLNIFWVGVVLAVARLWDGVNDPIMGYFADRTKTKIGSYRPYLFIAAIPFALAFVMMWYAPPSFDVAVKLAYFCFTYFLFDTFTTMIFIPYVALTPMIAGSYDDKTSLTSYRMVFSLSGTMIANTIPSMIIGPMRQANQATILLVAGGCGLIALAAFLTTAFGTKEPEVEIENPPKVREIIKEALTNKPYLIAIAIYLTTIMSFDLTMGSLLYFFEDSLHINSITIPLGLLFICSLISVPLIWNPLAKKLDKTKAYIIGIAFMILARLVIMLQPSDVNVILLYALFALSGLAFGAGQTLPWAIAPDTMDYGELKTGKRNDAALYSLMTLSRKIASALSPLIIGVGLTIGGYAANIYTAPGSSVDVSIRTVFGAVPIVLMLLGILAAAKYPLKREESERISRELAARRKGQEA